MRRLVSNSIAGHSILSLVLFSTALMAATAATAVAAAPCVNPGGTSGCFSSINAAIAAAAPTDTITVAPGTYHERVVIGKPLSLIGANRHNTTIDATALSQGVYINGIDHPGLKDVVVSGFEIENANFEGILIANASSVTIRSNHVVNNNKGLVSGPPKTCPGLRAMFPFETAEELDCGEGIHLTGVDHSILDNNAIDHNAGGILISDETAATHDNLIVRNIVTDNPFDCGITLASHPPAPGTGGPHGVSHNTIDGNESSNNGLADGGGAGIGIFGSAPGTFDIGNVVIYNRLTNNGLPGLTMHGHIAAVKLNDNMIVGNFIAGNHGDSGDAATPGPTGINVFGVGPITGTVIAENIFEDEAVDIAVQTPAQVDVHLNDFLEGNVGIANLSRAFGTATVNATENWWGCPHGPGAPTCASVTGSDVLYIPWLTRPAVPEHGRGRDKE